MRDPLPAPATGRVLITGGARSGKSVSAEAMLLDAPAVTYVATGGSGADDPEWADRIRLHRTRRPSHWETVETLDLPRLLTADAEPTAAQSALLIDCLSTWLAGVMDEEGLWIGAPGADEALAVRIDGLVNAWSQTSRTVVAVTNEVGSGIVPETLSGRRYRDELGRLNARIAGFSDQVWWCVAGIPTRII